MSAMLEHAGRLCAVALATGVCFVATDARAETIRYDPETCSTDAGDQVFVRLQSGLAFAFPADDLWYLGGAPVEDAGPIANPSEPEGCPLNPIVTAAMAVVYRPVTPPAPGEPTDKRWSPQIMQIFGHDGPTSVQEVYFRRFTSVCDPEKANNSVPVTANLEECRALVGLGLQEDWPSYIVARAGSHPDFTTEGSSSPVKTPPLRDLGGHAQITTRSRMVCPSCIDFSTAGCRRSTWLNSIYKSAPSSRRAALRSTMKKPADRSHPLGGGRRSHTDSRTPAS